ncbi:MAG TPA: ATP-dependent DNA ligase [Candidatus Dormibacteraeota bacterium]|nr:ATP-dependent DNA ligase [Candidatus Dormibacteraeota bacterium]
MMLPVQPPVAPMLAKLQPDIPHQPGWLYEPKWDGFRAIVFRDGDSVEIASRNGQTLQRYFPELLDELKAALPERAVVDGEIVIAGPRGLDFDALLQRIHPAVSRVTMLAEKTPASFIAFDMLAAGDDDLRGWPTAERRARLEREVRPTMRVALTPHTRDAAEAAEWFTRYEGAGLDGVIAKPEALPYVENERLWVKIKHGRTCDCVVGGYRRASAAGGGVASLLLGLYDENGVLHHVGHTSSFNAAQRRELLDTLGPLEGGESFGGGRTPGGPSRWSQGRDMTWIPVQPTLVCEVSFDQLQTGRFRHASRFLRWRPDKDPAQCTYDQLEPPLHIELADVVRFGAPG